MYVPVCKTHAFCKGTVKQLDHHRRRGGMLNARAHACTIRSNYCNHDASRVFCGDEIRLLSKAPADSVRYQSLPTLSL